MNIVEKIDDQVRIERVLVSVSDKRGLDKLVLGLLEINPRAKIFSTGGTFARIGEILGARAADCLTQVSDYTGQPETQGGLVKTLDFKIYLGLLTETYNPAHGEDLKRTGAVPIDMVVVNLYPFRETVSKPNTTLEEARANIDIGGPCMIRAAAKNYIRVASVVDPADYDRVIEELRRRGGLVSLGMRFTLAKKAFEHTAAYDRAISGYLAQKTLEDVAGCYAFMDCG